MGFIDKLKAKKMEEDAKEQRIARELAEKKRREDAGRDRNILLFKESGIEDKFREYVEQVNEFLKDDEIRIERYKYDLYGFTLENLSHIDFIAYHKGLFTMFYSYMDLKNDNPSSKFSVPYYTRHEALPLNLERINEKYMERCVKWVKGQMIFVPKSWW